MLLARGVKFEEIVSKKLPYPLSDNPSYPEFEKFLKGLCNHIERLDYSTHFPRSLSDGDLYYFKQNGAPGYGDPLDRPLELCEKDLNDMVYTPDIMEKVYGVVAYYDEKTGLWKVDKEKSEKLRDEMRKKRLEKAIDFSEFYRMEREKIIESRFIRPVAKMYSEQRELSTRWWKEFIEFWQLSEDYMPEAEDIESYIEKVYTKHEELIRKYRSMLEEKGYDLSGVKHLTLAERR